MRKRVIQAFPVTAFLVMLIVLMPLGGCDSSTTQSSTPPVPTAIPTVSPLFDHLYRHGFVPTTDELKKIQDYLKQHPDKGSAAPSTLTYGGGIDGIGVTSGQEKVYLVFWGQQWGFSGTDGNGIMTFTSDLLQGAPYVQNLFKGLGTGGEQWSGSMTQYCDGSAVSQVATSCPSSAAHVADPTQTVLAGVWYDSSGFEPTQATGHDLAEEAINAAKHFGNTTSSSNRYAQYIIMSPPGTFPDGFPAAGFCAWHDYNGDSTLSGGPATSPYGDIAFTNLPYIPSVANICGAFFVNSGLNGALDGYSIVEGHEYAETITDQNPAGGWTNTTTGAETGDECAWISPGQQGGSGNVTMGNGTYAMQSTWSNDTNECDLSHPTVH